MKTRIKTSTGFLVILLVVVIVAGLALITPSIYRPLRPSQLGRAISNIRQVKLALDSFAMDHDGVYPNGETAAFYEIPLDGSSNALFRPLFASGNTNSERIFWVRGTAVCSGKRPDDITTTKGVFDPSKTLEAGDCGWAYVMNQTNVDNPSRPLLFDSPPAARGLGFDRDQWDGKVVVLRIDSSAKPERLTPQGTLVDRDNRELLTPHSDVWKGAPDKPAVTTIDIAYPLKPAKR